MHNKLILLYVLVKKIKKLAFTMFEINCGLRIIDL